MKRILCIIIVAACLLLAACTEASVSVGESLETAPTSSSSAASSSSTAARTSSQAAVTSTAAISSTAAVSVPVTSTSAKPPKTTAPIKLPTVDNPSQTGYLSPLTGLPIRAELVGKRPVAVMVNNIKASMPQLGISNADIVYECLAEGGITRLMCLFLDYEDLGTIGSVRSARDYYLDLAQIHDAVFIHAGGSELAYSQIKSRKIDALDGVRTTVSGVFWRDPDRLATMSREHTMVTNGEKIAYGIAKKKYRTENYEGFTPSYRFYSAPTAIDGKSASYIKIPNSSSYVAELSYNSELGLYLKNQFGKPHIDATTNTQLGFTNVIVLYTHQQKVDSYGRIAVDITGTGKGYYLYGGKAVSITWTRSDRDGGISLFNADGTPLYINCGKSYISIASESIYTKTVIK